MKGLYSFEGVGLPQGCEARLSGRAPSKVPCAHPAFLCL